MSLNVLSLEGKAFVEKPLDIVPGLLKKKNSVLWIDIFNPSKGDEEFIRQNFDVDDLFLSFLTIFNFRPRIISQPDFVYLSFMSLKFVKGELKKFPVKFFLGPNYLITVRNSDLEEINLAKSISTSIKGFTPNRPELLLYLIVDNVVNNYFPILDDVDDSLDELETSLFENSKPHILSNLFKIKRLVLELRKIISPERECLLFLSNRMNDFIDQDSIIYFRDIFDHLIRMQDMLDTYRDLITSSLDAYLSLVSNKLNEVMKVLTIFTTILMPLTLITSFYGMNVKFFEYSILGEVGTYYFALGLMLLISIIMFFYFKKKKWL